MKPPTTNLHRCLQRVRRPTVTLKCWWLQQYPSLPVRTLSLYKLLLTTYQTDQTDPSYPLIMNDIPMHTNISTEGDSTCDFEPMVYGRGNPCPLNLNQTLTSASDMSDFSPMRSTGDISDFNPVIYGRSNLNHVSTDVNLPIARETGNLTNNLHSGTDERSNSFPSNPTTNEPSMQYSFRNTPNPVMTQFPITYEGGRDSMLRDEDNLTHARHMF